MKTVSTERLRKPTRPMDPRRWLLQRNAYELLQKLEAMIAAPEPESVHRLRTGTRRSGALLESLLAAPDRTTEFRNKLKDARKLMRQWKKLRRAAGAVRDLDVHLDLVGKLEKATAKVAPVTNGPLHQQMEELKAWLKQQRRQRAATLQEEASKRVDRCRRLTLAVLGEAPAAIASIQGPPMRCGVRTPAALALEDFYSVSQANPRLDTKNLHDFRKSTKQARYVAEAGKQQPDAVAVDKALKRIQDAIGDWHDLDALQIEAEKALGKGGRELENLLRGQADKKMRLAIQASERMRRRLLGERLALRAHPAR